jgi:hypothetical protein
LALDKRKSVALEEKLGRQEAALGRTKKKLESSKIVITADKMRVSKRKVMKVQDQAHSQPAKFHSWSKKRDGTFHKANHYVKNLLIEMRACAAMWGSWLKVTLYKTRQQVRKMKFLEKKSRANEMVIHKLKKNNKV